MVSGCRAKLKQVPGEIRPADLEVFQLSASGDESENFKCLGGSL